MHILSENPGAETGLLEYLKGAADIIEEASASEIYFGFAAPGTGATSEAKFSIMKVSVSGTSPAAVTTTFKWANGVRCYNLVWDSRAAYTYIFKKF